MSDFIPRRYHDQQVGALTERAITAEKALKDLLGFIDPDILERHGFDWLAAVGELMPVEVPPAVSKKGRK